MERMIFVNNVMISISNSLLATIMRFDDAVGFDGADDANDDGDDGDDDDDDDDDSTNGDDAEMQVVEQLPVVKQEDLEDNESRKSSMASTQVPMKKRRDAYIIENIEI